MSSSYKPLDVKIPCDEGKPKKTDVYLLAAELQDTYGFEYFHEAVISALLSYDYYYYYCYDYYYEYYYEYYYSEYSKYYYDYDYSSLEKVIALLFLSAMCAEE